LQATLEARIATTRIIEAKIDEAKIDEAKMDEAKTAAGVAKSMAFLGA